MRLRRRNERNSLFAAIRATNLTGQLLAFARKQIVSPKIIDVNSQIKNVQTLIQPLLGEDIQITLALMEIVLPVLIDPGQFEQLLVNLAVNARDAMPMGGRLTIESHQITVDKSNTNIHPEVNPDDYAQLVITDTGSGMDSDMQRHVFEPFFTTKEFSGGTGLGLATCHGIVKQNGGHITISSEQNIGTSFKIYFPISSGEKVDEEQSSVESTTHSGSGTILVVEDEKKVLDLCVTALQYSGYRVLTAQTGTDGLQVAESFNDKIDVLFSDVVLPDMRGTEIGKKLTERYPDLCILYTSGYTENTIVRDGVLEENVNFLQKPYTPVQLTKVIRALLDRN